MTTTETFTPGPVVRAVDEKTQKPRGLTYGVGYALRPWGTTEVEVQWPGVPGTRRESVLDVAPYVEPAPVKRVRRSRRAV